MRNDIFATFHQMTAITLMAIVGIAVFKLLMARYPMPGVRDVVALV